MKRATKRTATASISSFCLLVSIFVGVAAAQPGFIVVEAFLHQPSVFRWLAPNGTLSPPIAQLPFTTSVTSLSPDGRSIRVVGGGAIYDVYPSGSLTLVTSSTLITAPVLLLPNDDGDLHLLNWNNFNGSGLLRVRNRVVTSVANFPSMNVYGWTTDPGTGNIVISGALRPGQPWAIDGVFFLDPTTGTTTSMLTPNYVSDGFGTHVGHDPSSDRFLDLRTARLAGNIDAVQFDRTRAVISAKTIVRAQGHTVYDLQPTALRGGPVRYWALLRDPTGQNAYVISLAADGSQISTFPVGSGRHYAYKLVNPLPKPLSVTMNATPNDRTVKLRFPQDANKPYISAFSLSGYSNGPRLADGRTIPLQIDALARLSIAGGVPGILTSTTGRLDANGEARVRLNANRFGTAVRGIRVWAAAVVIDPSAPSGVAEVAGPQLLTMR